MTIVCPSCDASYRIDAATLGGGRKVRCARCRAEWLATPTEPADDDARIIDVDPVEVEPIQGIEDAEPIDAIDADDPRPLAEALDARAKTSQRPGTSRRWFFGGRAGKPARPVSVVRPPRRRLAPRLRPIAVAAAAGVVVLGALLGGRLEVVRAAPALASLYAGIGLPVNVRGLAIQDLRSVERVEEGVPLLLVSGMVENVSAAKLDVPRLRLAVVGPGDRELYAWTTVATRSSLAPGESAAFRARLASPPAEGRGLLVRFLGRADLSMRPAH